MNWSRNRRAEAASIHAKKNRLRAWLLKGLSKHDLASLLKFPQFEGRCVFYLYHLRGVRNALGCGVPWPVVWLLSRYSQKHIFLNKQLFDSGTAMRDVDVFLHKLRWRRRLEAGSLPSIRVAKRRFFNPYKEELPHDDFDQWVQAFRNHMHEHVQRAHMSSRFSRRFTNMAPLHRFAMRMMREMQLLALPQDKHGGFAIIRFESYAKIKMDLLQSSVYTPCEMPDLEKAEVRSQRTLPTHCQ